MRRTIPRYLTILAVLLLPVAPVALAGSTAPAGALEVTSDFNGDGVADLAIGAPGEPENGLAGAGAVHVIYGTAGSGLQVDGSQRLTQSDAVPGDPEANDHFGAAIAAGDFNGDGVGDLAVGVPNEDAQDFGGELKVDAGKINVLYGTAGTGITSAGSQLWSQVGPGTKGDPEDGDHFGEALAAGDFNGDGFDDVAVGIPNESVAGIPEAGGVTVMYGTVDGIQVGTPDDQLWAQNNRDVEDDAEENDHLGSALAAGDFNQDNFADLAIGVPNENIGATGNAGAANVLYGTAAGLQVDVPLDQFWNQNSTNVRGTAEGADEFATALASGDFDGDLFIDLAIGVPQEDTGGVSNMGAVAVLYGGPNGLQATSRDDQLWDQDSDNVRDVGETGDRLGRALAAADFDGDGTHDLAAGVPGEVIGGVDDAGAVMVLYGASGGLQASSPDDDIWHQNTTDVNQTAETNDEFGTALGAANFDPNRAGEADLVVGVPDEGIDGESRAGTVHVLYSTASGLQASSPSDQLWNQSTEGVVGDPEPDDEFGGSLSAA